ncbi:hypothetical protein [Fulvimarina pelagi]|nr:hypothetical protein [Fulvimarina pelagi]
MNFASDQFRHHVTALLHAKLLAQCGREDQAAIRENIDPDH